MGCTYTSEKGNKITMLDNGLLEIKPKQGSSMFYRFYSIDNVISIIEYYMESRYNNKEMTQNKDLRILKSNRLIGLGVGIIGVGASIVFKGILMRKS